MVYWCLSVVMKQPCSSQAAEILILIRLILIHSIFAFEPCLSAFYWIFLFIMFFLYLKQTILNFDFVTSVYYIQKSGRIEHFVHNRCLQILLCCFVIL